MVRTAGLFELRQPVEAELPLGTHAQPLNPDASLTHVPFGIKRQLHGVSLPHSIKLSGP